MRILLLGSGGREHAIGRALRTDPSIALWSAPGNPGLATLGELVALDPCDADAVLAACRAQAIELVIVGPEAPLVAGVADTLRAAGVAVCGPSQACAALEGSKSLTRTLCAELGVPSPHHRVVTNESELLTALRSWQEAPPVLKADGLAGGKGVFLPDTLDECTAIGRDLLNGSLGAAGSTVVLEQRLVGREASLFYACHGTHWVALPHARDHKRIFDGERGPNTGGMGAISPNPLITDDVVAEVEERMVHPLLAALAQRGTPYVGFLFLGLMLTEAGPKLLEINVRLGDPETQAILPRLADGELARLCLATARGGLEGFDLRVTAETTCAVVLAAAGYPDTPRRGDTITLGEELETPERWFIHAGTARHAEALVTAGGRVGAVVARAPRLADAVREAYRGVTAVAFAGMQHRSDIGRT